MKYYDFFQTLCRLCAKEQVAGIPLNNQFGDHDILRSKISKYLQFQISLDDPLPKMICVSCCSKLESFSIFVKNAQHTQELLRTRFELLNNGNVLSPDDNTPSSKTNREGEKDQSEIISLKKTIFDQLETDVTIRLIKQGENDFVKPENNQMSGKKNILLTKQLEESLKKYECKKGENNEHKKIVTCIEENIIGKSFNIISKPMNVNLVKTKPTKTPPERKSAHRCELCEKKFCSDIALKGHKWSHENRNLNCKICNSFVDSSSGVCLNSMCELSSNTCQICARTFKKKSKLRQHLTIHSEIKKFECNKCGERFKRERQLKFHMNRHTGLHPYKCPYCPQTFYNTSNCHAHRKRAHPLEPGVAPFRCPNKCSFCKETFKKKALLMEHLKLHESITKADLATCFGAQTSTNKGDTK